MLKKPRPISQGDKCRIRLADDRVFQGYMVADDGASLRFAPTPYGCNFSLAGQDLKYIRKLKGVHYLRHFRHLDWVSFYMNIVESGIVKK